MAKSPSVITRVADILNLFGPERPLISVDEVAAQLRLSAASAYRYVGDLTDAGWLSRTSGRYRLGPKIIELEYLIQSYDPIIRAGQDLMKGLAEFTGCNVLLCNVYDENIVNVTHMSGNRPIKLTYTKGMRMPLFRGAQAHIILSYMDRRKLKRLYERALNDDTSKSDVYAIGSDWKHFSKRLKEIRSDGYYISKDELDPGFTGIAAPVFGEAEEIVGSLVLIYDRAMPLKLSESALVELVKQSASEISKNIELLTQPEARPRF